MWIARDKNSSLGVYLIKPSRKEEKWSDRQSWIELDRDFPLGKDLTWEDEPREVELAPKGALEKLKQAQQGQVKALEDWTKDMQEHNEGIQKHCRELCLTKYACHECPLKEFKG